MTTTAIDLTVGMNLRIGSVPVALAADLSSDADGKVYLFNGSVQDYDIDLGQFMAHVGQQFGVDVELPPELNLQAKIVYVAGQVRYSKPKSGADTTEMGIAARFELHYADNKTPLKIGFYADTILTSGSKTRAYVVGAALDTDLPFSKLPLIGSIPVLKEYALKNLGFSYTNTDPKDNDGKPVKFTLPKVSEEANPLKPKDGPPSSDSKSYSIDTKGDQTTFSLDRKGFAFTAGLMREGSDTALSNFSLPLNLPKANASVAPALFAANVVGDDAKTSPAASPINWINVNKTFGPVNLQKIGLNYKGGEATFGLSADFAVGGFTLALQGLSISFPLPLPGIKGAGDVSFNLDGMAMDFQKGGLQMSGAFLKSVVNGYTNYFGEVGVQVSNYGFKAIGGYAPAQDNKPAAFFIYANLAVPLGGPPFLYVSGLAFGFGVNYALNLPTIDTLPGYLLLPGKAPKQPDKAGKELAAVLEKLAGGAHPVITNQPGQYWVAAGIQFTSFNMVSAFALVTVSFGVRMEVGLLGSCAITLPKGAGANPLAYVEIDLVASFSPETGVLPVAGIISPASYLYGGFVKISGGFGLAIWTSGERKGDFVVSLGGYNNAYNRPDGYPVVPRLKLGFALGPFQASGSAYMALTPGMFMAGMQFSATFSAGSIRAWFNCGVDFLLGWAPFLYRANAYVNIGCSVDLGLFTLSVSVGADVQVWGPEFGGKAHVDLDIVSFTIGFGSSAPNPAPVSWANIEQNFLPGASSAKQPLRARSANMLRLRQAAAADASQLRAAPGDSLNIKVVTASVAAGLLQTDVVDAQQRRWNWVIDPDSFRIVTETSIPANEAYWTSASAGKASIPNELTDFRHGKVTPGGLPYLSLVQQDQHFNDEKVWNPEVNVKPMKLSKVRSQYQLTLAKADKDGKFTEYVSAIQLQPLLGNSNTALWGNPDAESDANTQALLTQTLVGFNLIAVPRQPGVVSNVPLMQLLFTQGNRTTFRYTGQQSDTRYQVSSKVSKPDYALDITIGGAVTRELPPNQHFTLSALTDDWVTTQRNAVLDDLLAQGLDIYTPAQIDLKAMARTEELTDWPAVALLGEVAA